MISIKISTTAATQLAMLCKRAYVERLEAFAEDTAEARKMLAALEELRETLAAQGFAPR
jgi:hypothetical protein